MSDVVRVILEDPDRFRGMDHADFASRGTFRSPAFCEYDEAKAWPSRQNVFEIPVEQFERWKAAKEAHRTMQAEIRDLIRQRERYLWISPAPPS